MATGWLSGKLSAAAEQLIDNVAPHLEAAAAREYGAVDAALDKAWRPCVLGECEPGSALADIPPRYALLLRATAALLDDEPNRLHKSVRRLEALLFSAGSRSGGQPAACVPCTHCGDVPTTDQLLCAECDEAHVVDRLLFPLVRGEREAIQGGEGAEGEDDRQDHQTRAASQPAAAASTMFCLRSSWSLRIPFQPFPQPWALERTRPTKDVETDLAWDCLQLQPLQVSAVALPRERWRVVVHQVSPHELTLEAQLLAFRRPQRMARDQTHSGQSRSSRDHPGQFRHLVGG